MRKFYAYFISFSFFFAFVLAETGFALNPDFYRQKKIKKELEITRERGAKFLAGKRKKRAAQRERETKDFSKVRRRMELAKKKRESLLEKDSRAKEKFKSRKIDQALRSAKKKRQKSEISWEEENIEFDITVPKKKNKAD